MENDYYLIFFQLKLDYWTQVRFISGLQNIFSW